MLAVPVFKLGVGVNTAVRVAPVPEIALRVPLLSVMSPVVPSQTKVLPGSSLKVKVMLEVSPDLSWPTLDVMLKNGAVVSTVKLLLSAVPGASKVVVLARGSCKVLPFNDKALTPIAMPLASVWPA